MLLKILILLICSGILVQGIKNKSKQDNISGEQNNAISLANGITIKPNNFERSSILKWLSSESNYLQFELLADQGLFKIENSSVQVIEVQEGLFEIKVDAKLQSLHFEHDFIFNNDLKIWKLYKVDISNKHEEISGWTDNSSSLCGQIFMLGGFGNFAKGEVKRIYENLPEHTQVRIVANYHFIDQWLGEVGFMKINSHLSDASRLEYVWVQKYDTSKMNNENPLNVCGSSYPEFQLNQLIDIVVPHNKQQLIIAFGSTLETEDPAEASFGISNIQIYIQ